MKTGLRKLSLLALAFGITASGMPGIASAASSTNQTIYPLIVESALQNLASSSAPVISPGIDIESPETVRVIVQLSEAPAAAVRASEKQSFTALSAEAAEAAEAAVDQEQADVLQQAQAEGLDLNVHYTYNTVLNGFEISIPANKIPELASIPGVASIHENSVWSALPDSAPTPEESTTYLDEAPLKQIRADWAWANTYTGKGLKVGIVDSGVDRQHPDIAPAYRGGYDSVNGDSDPNEEPPIPAYGLQASSHGTHIAGIIVGQAANDTGEIRHKGVAPDAELYVYKVLSRNPVDPTAFTGTSAQIIDGIEHAIKDGVDVLNLSLGSETEQDVNSPEAIAINNAVLSGITVVTASGNTGPGLHTLGSLAVAQLAIAVGSVTAETSLYKGSLTPEAVLKEDPSVVTATYSTYGAFQTMAYETGKAAFADILGTKPLELVYVGLGRDRDYPSDVAGKVVLISRGDLSYDVKIKIARKHHALAAIYFNNNSYSVGGVVDLSPQIPGRDGYIDVFLGDSPQFVPTFEMTGAEGRALARSLKENPDTRLQVTFNPAFTEIPRSKDQLSSFSSRGPNADSQLSIKPDVVAPGQNIMSTTPANEFGKPGYPYSAAYDRLSGTSIASAHVTGLALLIKQAHPNYTPADIRAALSNTAVDIGEEHQGQGSGRVDVKEAIETSALLQAVEPITLLDKSFQAKLITNLNSSASFGVVRPGSDALSKTLTLANKANKALSYASRIEWDEQLRSDSVKATLSQSAIDLAPQGVQSFELQLTVGADTPLNTRYEGTVVLTSSDPDQPVLRLPFVVYAGEEAPAYENIGIQELALTNKIIYPKRSAQSSTDLTFRLATDKVNLYQIYVLNLNNQPIGLLDIPRMPTQRPLFEPGTYSLKKITGQYISVTPAGLPVIGSNGQPVIGRLDDGTYKIYIQAAQLTAAGGVAVDSTGKAIAFAATTSFRVDNSPESDNTGTGGNLPSIPALPAYSNAAQAVINPERKPIVLAPIVALSDLDAKVTLSDDAFKTALSSIGSAPAVLVIADNAITRKNASLSLTPEQAKQLASFPAKSTIVFGSSGSAIALPTELLAKAPADAKSFVLTLQPAEKSKALDSKISAASGTLIGTPISYDAKWLTAGGKQPLVVKSPQFIKRSFTVPGSIDPNTAGVLVDQDGFVAPIASSFKKQTDGTTLVTVSRPGFSVYAAVARKPAFTDIDSSYAAADIQALANKWIVDGATATTFSPKANLTRAEFTALLVRALGLTTEATDAQVFTDVKSSDWFAAEVTAANNAGLIKGIGGGKFAPNDKVTREELAVILDRAFKLTGGEWKQDRSNPIVPFADDAKISAYAKDSVNLLAEAGVIDGFTLPGGSFFRPNTAATREFAAYALHHLLIQAGLME
ncbi:S8 family serine peptidase [Gorillibacterium timonense]|uniref:S8 family serine peptidase n=1 Tax=Gorillibacterium timonense TaxID=1689269 RepID=UPI00071D605C|nr:S8 family serine peptidase [Gorillibacterium timonense]